MSTIVRSTVSGRPDATPDPEPKLERMSLRTTPFWVRTFGPFVPSPGNGPAVSSGIGAQLASVAAGAVVVVVAGALVVVVVDARADVLFVAPLAPPPPHPATKRAAAAPPIRPRTSRRVFGVIPTSLTSPLLLVVCARHWLLADSLGAARKSFGTAT